MNIFYLHNDTKVCAELHVDKHVVKMIVEYAQLLSTAKRMIDGVKYQALSKTGRKVQRYRLPNPNEEATVYKAVPYPHPSADIIIPRTQMVIRNFSGSVITTFTYSSSNYSFCH